MAEKKTKKVDTSIEKLSLKDIEETPKKNPRVLSSIWLTDKDFEIKKGEIKYLPDNYKTRLIIMNEITAGKLKILKKDSDDDDDESLDGKDVINFLNQNTKTVLKQMRINELSEIDLNNLLIAERSGLGRRDIMKFIKEKLKEE